MPISSNMPLRQTNPRIKPYVGGGVVFNVMIAEVQAAGPSGVTNSASVSGMDLGLDLLGGVNYRLNGQMLLFGETQYSPGTGAGGAGGLNLYSIESGLRFGS